MFTIVDCRVGRLWYFPATDLDWTFFRCIVIEMRSEVRTGEMQMIPSLVYSEIFLT